ncbi:hypothetical protein NPIL_430151 [Nephila pilipes]|uniref:Uncharacterized protein n=1 Tax=Nephila pilipes TaxID=299642 RepID=A0A8X6NS22_NEPPI|nr:hypothetical protein NPIL_430151 [Nephila pilipes]
MWRQVQSGTNWGTPPHVVMWYLALGYNCVRFQVTSSSYSLRYESPMTCGGYAVTGNTPLPSGSTKCPISAGDAGGSGRVLL